MLLVRHGQSEFNVIYAKTRIDPGIEDPALTDLGREQARGVVETLREAGIRRLIASPYTRALQTAAEIRASLDLPLSSSRWCASTMPSPAISASPRSLLQDHWPDLDFSHLDEVWWPNERETEHDVQARGVQFRDAMAQESDWAEVAVILPLGLYQRPYGTAGDELRDCPSRPNRTAGRRGPDASSNARKIARNRGRSWFRIALRAMIFGTVIQDDLACCRAGHTPRPAIWGA